MGKRYRLKESTLRGMIREAVEDALGGGNDSVRAEVEAIVEKMGSHIEGWFSEHRFCDDHGFVGSIYNSEEEAEEDILNGDEHQNAIDDVEVAMTEEDWVDYLEHCGYNIQQAKDIIYSGAWGKLVEIIVGNEGPQFFLATYSGKVHSLSNGMVLYY